MAITGTITKQQAMLNKLRIFLFHRTQKEILKKLIPYYKHCLCQLTERDYHEQGKDYKINLGICLCADKIFNKEVHCKKWVQKHRRKHSIYWFKRPANAYDFTEYKSLIQQRIDLMEKILKEL